MQLYGLLEEASEIGSVDLSDVKLPDISRMKLPEISMPSVGMPSMDAFKVPSMDMKAFGSLDTDLVLPVAGVSALLLLGLVATASSSGKGASPSASKKRKKIKVNPLDIPYHAAAQLAYTQWLEAHPDYGWDDAAYQSFQTSFERHAVAEATAKKLKRDLQNFTNEPLPEPQPRRESEKPTTKGSGVFFFANSP